jgi:hypothetical protein
VGVGTVEDCGAAPRLEHALSKRLIDTTETARRTAETTAFDQIRFRWPIGHMRLIQTVEGWRLWKVPPIETFTWQRTSARSGLDSTGGRTADTGHSHGELITVCRLQQMNERPPRQRIRLTRRIAVALIVQGRRDATAIRVARRRGKLIQLASTTSTLALP